MEGCLDLRRQLLLIFLFFLCKFACLCLVLQLFISQILLVGLIEAVSGITHDHVQKSLKHLSLEIALQIFLIDIVNP